jgi:hypothetical protein
VRNLYAALATATLFSLVAVAQPLGSAAAQPVPEQPSQSQSQAEQQAVPNAVPAAQPDEPVCGSWESGTWIPSGACGPNDYRSHVTGTITAVKGHLVTIQQSTKEIVINDQPALDQRTSGKVAVGRQVVAVGFWRNGTTRSSTDRGSRLLSVTRLRFRAVRRSLVGQGRTVRESIPRPESRDEVLHNVLRSSLTVCSRRASGGRRRRWPAPDAGFGDEVRHRESPARRYACPAAQTRQRVQRRLHLYRWC